MDIVKSVKAIELCILLMRAMPENI